MPPLLQLTDLAAGYGHRHLVFADFSLTLERGQAACLYGPSGSGKTTALMTAAGLLRPRRGTVQHTARRLAFVFQDDCLLPWRNARDNIIFALARDFSAAEAGERADAWLDHFGLAADRRKMPGDLSGGMRRRVNIARALAGDPDLLFLDEALSYLDEAMAARCLQAIADWQAATNGGILAVTHDRSKLRLLRPAIFPWPPAAPAPPPAK